MTDTVILHAGSHKTGSTALQTMFLANRDRLQAAGICYPEAGLNGAGHHDLVEACREGNTAMLNILAAQAAPFPTLLISSENFSGLSAGALGRLKSVFPTARFQVIYYLRRLTGLWRSHWCEMIKHGQGFSFADFMLQTTRADLNPFTAPPVPAVQLGTLASVFGLQALQIFSYDLITQDGADIGQTFAASIPGLSYIAGDFSTTRINPASPDWQTELVRMFNQKARIRMDYAAQLRLRLLLLCELRQRPPNWLDRFKGVVSTSPCIELSTQSPLIRAMQDQVITGFSTSFTPDPDAVTETYSANNVTRFPLFDRSDLDSADQIAIDMLIDHLSDIALGSQTN